jgi:diphosphomevalonate decarboxylase
VSSGPKEVSSTSGMQQSVDTSDLLKHRAAAVVPARMERMKTAIAARDFNNFAMETIKDSNQFHAVCLDTYPPIFYMNDTSKKIVHVLDTMNQQTKDMQVAYTFDAGPNAVVYLLDDKVEATLAALLHAFQPVR